VAGAIQDGVSGGLKVIEPGEMPKPRWNPNNNEWLFA
jgi:hypothetical protein